MVKRFGTWNLRTVLQAGNMGVIAEGVEQRKMDVATLQEIRWKGKGSIRKEKFTLRYSGNDREGNRGVGFIVSKKVLEFSPISERICTLRFEGKFHNITFVKVHAPTGDTEDEIVDEFYETLQSVCDEIAKHDAIITLGDFNAKLGKEQLYKDVIGRHSLYEVTNNNGLRLVQYATINNFKVLSTWYPRKDIHRRNWKIPGTNDINQIDHIIFSKGGPQILRMSEHTEERPQTLTPS